MPIPQNKKDVYENTSELHCKKYRKCKSMSDRCCESICDRLDLVPPDDACEKKNVKHCFQVTLGKYEVVRDVKVTHCVTANLKHHIKENIICEHKPCTKHTYKNINSVNDGKCCKVDFPKCDDKIEYVDEKSCNKKFHSSSTGSSSKSSCDKSSDLSSCGNTNTCESIFSHHTKSKSSCNHKRWHR